MKVSKRTILMTILTVIIIYALALYKLPFYIYKPGSADALDPVVAVEGGFRSKGDMHLVTVSGGQATPISYALSKVLPHHEIHPIKDIFPEGVEEDEYMEEQLYMMESSQQAATVVAYEAADADIHIKYNGVYVLAVISEMPAYNKLEKGDRIYQIDDQKVKEADDLINYIDTLNAGQTVTIHYIRDGVKEKKDITLEALDKEKKRIGIGIQLTTDREVDVEPKVTFASGNIGGPSAGLMFALEIYDQLTKNDLTKGKQIAGTGEIDYDGNVYAIGGVDKKVIAADREGCKIFFAPNEDGKKGSNYEVAKATAKEINTSMKIVPVDHFDEALKYLQDM